MTNVTSSRFVKGTPKTEDEPDINGTQPIDSSSGSTSLFKTTAWIVELETGHKRRLTIEGGRGRISFNRGPRGSGDARFYRNESTKVYDAVVSGVTAIYSDRCTVETRTSSGAVTIAPTSSGRMATPPPPWEVEEF